MASSAAPAPTSLAAALQRVSHLEQQLQQIELALQRATGSGIDHLLSSYQLSLSSESNSPHPAAAAASSDSPETTSATSSRATLEPIDISPYILKALAIRKGVKEGSIDDSRHEDEVRELTEGTGLSESQVQQLRDWAGL